MSNTRDKAGSTTTRYNRQALGRGLLSWGLFGMVLGEAIFLILIFSHVTSDDAYMGFAFLALFLVPISSLLVLVSLFLLKVHWLLAIGAILLPLLLAAYWSKRLFNNSPDLILLTYGGGVIVLSLILVVSVAVIKAKSSKISD